MIRHDPEFPGLSTALDTDAVLQLLKESLPACADGLELLGNTVMDVRYRPGGPCWVLYRLKIREGRRHSRRVLLSGHVLRINEPPDEAPAELAAGYASLEDKPLGTPMMYLPDAHMVVYSFPVDEALPGLFDAADPRLMRKHLSRLWAKKGVRVLKVAVETRGYTPRARAAFFYEVLCEDRHTGAPEIRRLVGKMHAKKPAARIFADAWALWRAGGGKLSLAPPVGYIGAAGLTLQEQVQGERLGGLVDQPGLAKRVRTTAHMLARMHASSAPLSTRRKPAEEAEGVHRWAGVLMAIRPDLAPRIEQLRDRLASKIEICARLTTPIHADFHHTNVLVDGDRVTVIDLDEMAFGDPMVDVGRFLASLRVPARRAFGSISALDEVGGVFLDEYLRRTGGDEKRVRLFEAAALLISGGSSFRIQRAGWKEEVTLLVDESERLLRAAGKVTVGTGDIRQEIPSPEEQQDWAQDGVYMQAVLDPHVRTVYEAQLTRCRVANPGGGRRVRYALRGFRHGARWEKTVEATSAGKHGGRGLMRRMEMLRSALGGSPDVPVLPRPVAYIKTLSLLVWEAPSGTRFSSLLGTPDATAAARKIASSLVTLHHTDVEFDHQRSLHKELTTLKARLRRLQDVDPELGVRAAAVGKEVDVRTRSVPGRMVPVVRTLHPHHILHAGNRVALDKVEEVTLSHPFLDVSDFLARLTLLGLLQGRIQEASTAADHFREVYLDADGGDAGVVATFEAGALLRLVCREAERDPGGTSAGDLLEQAEQRLAS